MSFIKKNAVLLLIVLAAAAALYLYYSYSGGGEPPLTTETISPVSRDLLVTLAALNTMRLNEKIFTDPVFASLSDFGVVIPPQAVGRRNPFAPAP